MTFNEQRAHDLALHFVDEIIESKMHSEIEEQISQGRTIIEAPRDIYKEYKELYIAFLECLNRDFPQSK
ncbi:MAG: hypothetical protein ACLRJ3_15980 [Thomasclavelia ramosa]